MADSSVFAYEKYMMKVIDKYECGFIEKEKIQQYLNSLELWEFKFRRLSMAKQRVTLLELLRDE